MLIEIHFICCASNSELQYPNFYVKPLSKGKELCHNLFQISMKSIQDITSMIKLFSKKLECYLPKKTQIAHDLFGITQKLREINYATAFLALIARKNRPIKKEEELI